MSKRQMDNAVIKDLARSGLDSKDAKKLHLRFVETVEMYDRFKIDVPAYEIPYFRLDGTLSGRARFRLLGEYIPKSAKKPIKYFQPPGTSAEFYFPPYFNWKKIANDPTIPILITEGEKKAAAACKNGLPTIGLGGVWNWLTKDE